MKYIFALISLMLTINIQGPTLQAHNLVLLSSYSTSLEFNPIKKGIKKGRKRRSIFKKKKRFKKKYFKVKDNSQKRLRFTLILIGGILLAILSIVLLLVLTPTIGTITAGVAMGIAKYFGWIGFAACVGGALVFIWMGIAALNTIPKEDFLLTPTEKSIEENIKKYPNVPSQKIEEYVALDKEIAELEDQKEDLEWEKTKESQEALEQLERRLEAKEKKQIFLRALNEELEEIPSENKMEYIQLKEEIEILKGKKLLIQDSIDENDKIRVKKIDARIEANFEKLIKLKG